MNGVTTGFLYDGAQAIAELKGSALDTVYHTGLEIDEVLARYGAGGNKTLLTDALMSVIAQANDDQSVQNFYGYSPYGEAQTQGPDGGNPLQYTGREADGTGLYYYRARYYDPVIKRFISEDPIGILGGINPYAYVGGDPITYADPLGWAPKDKWYGRNDPNFRDWVHQGKQDEGILPGNYQHSKEEIEDLWKQWNDEGQPRGKGGKSGKGGQGKKGGKGGKGGIWSIFMPSVWHLCQQDPNHPACGCD